MKAAIVGATGYAGRELHGRLLSHGAVESIQLMSARADAAVAALDARGNHMVQPQNLELLATKGSFDVVFACLPHGVGIATVQAALSGGATVIDLSADLRFKDPAAYAAAYGAPHPAPELCDAAAYGLTEHERTSLVDARLIACPGCYPTASLLGILPLTTAGIAAKGTRIVVDAKSGVSGAGKSPSDVTLYGNVNESCRAYGVGNHRHAPEIRSRIESADGDHGLSFVPHLLPMFRGMLATVYLEPAPGENARSAEVALRAAYANEPFVHVMDEQPRTADVAGTNHCHLAVEDVDGAIVVTSAIDNLVKGAAGQAVQNMNVSFGLSETEGLR